MTKSAIDSCGSGSGASYSSDGDAADSPGGSVGLGADYSIASEEYDGDRKKPVNRDGGTRNKSAPVVSKREINEVMATVSSVGDSSSSTGGGASKRFTVRKPAVYPGTRKRRQ